MLFRRRVPAEICFMSFVFSAARNTGRTAVFRNRLLVVAIVISITNAPALEGGAVSPETR
jgi:hypothetical protein